MSISSFSEKDTNTQWRRFCNLLWFNEDLDFWLDISRMSINDSDFQDLIPLFNKALKAIDTLESGAVANIDENRQVGHYWLRKPDLAPNALIEQKINENINQVETFGKSILEGLITSANNKRFTDVLWIGIGGSGLGPLLIVNSLRKQDIGLNFHFIDNVDPVGISNTLFKLEESLESTLCVVVSKSGGTPEPRIGMQQVRNYFEDHGYRWSDIAVAITMPDSKLYKIAQDEKWLKSFDLPDWVGGRTSITSSVGLLPCVLVGSDIHEFLSGASLMDQCTRSKDYLDNPAILLASSWFFSGEGKGKRDMVILPYRDSLEVFSRYLQQLIMESLGKRLDRKGNLCHQGIAVYGNKGSTDQHAYVQQLRDGIDNFFVTFIEVLNSSRKLPTLNNEQPEDYLSGFLQGTRTALAEGGRQSVNLTLKEFNSRSLGALIALFERAVSLYAEFVDINAYNQPGVEAGKAAAQDILKLQSNIQDLLNNGQPMTISDLATQIHGSTQESIFSVVRHLYFSTSKYHVKGEWKDPNSIQVMLSS